MMTVGIDPHKRSHTAVMIDAAGTRVAGPITVTDQPEAVDRLRDWAARHAPGQPISWAIEDGRGLASRLAAGLTAAAGAAAVVWVPVRLMAAARRGSPARGKSDPIDAAAVAAAAVNPDNARLLAPAAADPLVAGIRELVDTRNQKVADRTRLINTLRWRLHRLGVAAPARLTSLAAPARLATALAGLAEQTEVEAAADMAVDDCQELAGLTRRIRRLERRLAGLVEPACPHLLAIRGVGVLTAARLVADAGGRVATGAGLARMAGTAPIPVWTSDHTRHRLDRGGNRRLNHAIHQVAVTQIRWHAPARQLYQSRQPVKGRKGAMRVLKRHLTDVLHRALIADFPLPT